MIKLNALWKQFDALVQLPICTCHAAEDFKKHNQLMKLMQFLMGLDDAYMQIRSNILSREPLPDVEMHMPLSLMISLTKLFLVLVLAKKESSDEESLTSRSEDEEYAMALRDFKKSFKRRGRFMWRSESPHRKMSESTKKQKTKGFLLEDLGVIAAKMKKKD
ncbi:hypothetical protein Tco_0481450 [Tanacetum coccineum]